MRDLTWENMSHEVLLCGTFLEHCFIIKDMINYLWFIVFAKLFLNSCFDVEVTQSQLDGLPEGIMNMDIH